MKVLLTLTILSCLLVTSAIADEDFDKSEPYMKFSQICKETNRIRGSHVTNGDITTHFIVVYDDKLSFMVIQAKSNDTKVNCATWNTTGKDFVKIDNITASAGGVFSFFFFEDTNKTGQYNETMTRYPINFKIPKIRQDNESDSSMVTFEMEEKNLTVTLQVKSVKDETRMSSSPGILYSNQSLLFNVIIEGETTCPLSNNTEKPTMVRVGMEFDIAHANYTPLQQSIPNMDDEYSPGVFSLDYIILRRDKDDIKDQQYLSYKPVSYAKEDKKIAHLADLHVQIFENATTPNMTNLILEDLIAKENLVVHKGYFTAGGPVDAPFQESKYSSFAFNLGIGEIPTSSLSSNLKKMIWIGIGIPAFALICSSIYVVYIKFVRSPRGEPLL